METREARGGVLVLGGGFAGAYVARLLGERGATIVSPENFMLYTPLLPEAASGTLEPRHAVVPLRIMCPHAELLLGSATGIDIEARTAQIETDAGAQTLRWHDLVLALGAVPRVAPVPGLTARRLRGTRARAARCRDPREHHARLGVGLRGRACRRRAHPHPHARVDGRRCREPPAARTRPTARRASSRRGGPAAARKRA